MKITARLLKSKGACQGQVDKFKRLFPRGVVATEALCVKHAQVFDWAWAADNLLSEGARAEYDRATASARAEYERATASALVEYKCAMAPALAEYKCATVSARAEYDRVMASTFGRLAEGM